jgi:anti-sigma regulatory factor (Ser/Thr protein kinase)
MRVSVEIPVEPEAMAIARDVVATIMVDATAPRERIEEVLLLTSEVVSHVIRRADPDSEGSIGLLIDLSSDRLRVEVTDPLAGSEPRSTESSPAKDAGGGWGLIFVAELSDLWGAEPDSIWFELNL